MINRRNFIRTTGISLASVLMAETLFANPNKQKNHLINFPDEVTAMADGHSIQLYGKENQNWMNGGIEVNLINSDKSILVRIQAPGLSLSSVTLKWKTPPKTNSLILNDQWERTYGDASWHQAKDTEVLPWYFMEFDGKDTYGFGVKTAPNSFCFWQIGDSALSLTMDTRSGGMGVQLGNRKLNAAEIVTIKSQPDKSAFQTTRDFTRMMCEKARLPKKPVYGINDWYFSYGNNSEKLIIEHTKLMMPMAGSLSNPPFSVIDAGWFERSPSAPDDSSWGDVSTQNLNFGDMSSMAGKIRSIGMRPGIWTRPLCGGHKDPKSIMLPLIKGRKVNNPVLDPSIPENLERIKSYFKLYSQWTYEMVKFDYTSFDIFGKWGFEMMKDGSMTELNWKMYDQSQTNAEIILRLYKSIREGSGDNYIIGCNTISHLSAGIFELNRIGDDTSGNEWERTRGNGVNTLAFRGVQHGTFYSADADCVGLTVKADWQKNKQWMELVANSGTPLFISAQPEAIGTIQKSTIKECFNLASQELPLGEPLDWMERKIPNKWKLNGKIEIFNWD